MALARRPSTGFEERRASSLASSTPSCHPNRWLTSVVLIPPTTLPSAVRRRIADGHGAAHRHQQVQRSPGARNTSGSSAPRPLRVGVRSAGSPQYTGLARPCTDRRAQVATARPMYWSLAWSRGPKLRGGVEHEVPGADLHRRGRPDLGPVRADPVRVLAQRARVVRHPTGRDWRRGCRQTIASSRTGAARCWWSRTGRSCRRPRAPDRSCPRPRRRLAGGAPQLRGARGHARRRHQGDGRHHGQPSGATGGTDARHGTSWHRGAAPTPHTRSGESTTPRRPVLAPPPCGVVADRPGTRVWPGGR